MAGLQKRIGAARKGWVEELPGVLWAYRTTPRRATQETPFCLVYGSEAVIPVETSVATVWILDYEEANNEKLREKDLHLLDAVRSNALVRTGAYKSRMAKAYNRGIIPRPLHVGDLVLRRTDVLKHISKLQPNWDGPYRVVKAGLNGSYQLEDLEGVPLERTWNARNLRKYYY